MSIEQRGDPQLFYVPLKTYKEAPYVAVLKRNIMNRFIANMGPVFIPSLGTPSISHIEIDVMTVCFSMVPPTIISYQNCPFTAKE
jgi:hypothetical protein